MNWALPAEMPIITSHRSPTRAPSSTSTASSTPTMAKTPTQTPSNTPISTLSVHVGDLDGTMKGTAQYWQAVVIITIHNNYHLPVANARVNRT